MQTVIIVVHLMVVIALVGVILVQKSEGGGLGIGGGSGFMTARGAANVLTRTTAILAAIFFATSLGLSLIARYGSQPMDILNQAPSQQQTQGKPGSAPAKGGNGILDQLGGKSTQTAPAAPATSSANQPQGKTAPAPQTTAPAKSAAPSSSTQAPAAPATGQQPKVPNQ